MPRGIVAMSLIQFVIAVYLVMGIGIELKIRYKIEEHREDPPASLAKAMRDFGPVLLLIPAGWAVYALRRWKKNGTDLRESGHMMVTGFATLALLLVIAVFAHESVWRNARFVFDSGRSLGFDDSRQLLAVSGREQFKS